MESLTESQNGKQPAISAYLITMNEERNVARAIESVRWMDEVIVLDSGSTDRTVDIAKELGARVRVEPFRGFVEQKNRAMELCSGELLFNLDADEEVTPELRRSILEMLDATSADGPDTFAVCRRTWYMGAWIRHCGWYPEYRERLSKRGCARWEGEILHESLRGIGRKGRLVGDLLHRPYAGIDEHAKKIVYYAELWARRELSKGRRASIFDMISRPAARFLKMYVVRAGFLDRTPGLTVSIMGAWYAFMKYAKLHELSRNSE
jgi:(heptosyl)LPS beta-1,4-glucosyltransferase